MTWYSSRDDEKKCPSQFHYLYLATCLVTNPSCTLTPQLTVFGLSVTEAVLSAAQADTLYSLALGFAESKPCNCSSHLSVARRHLHHMKFELHGIPCTEHTKFTGQKRSRTHMYGKSVGGRLWSIMLSVHTWGRSGLDKITNGISDWTFKSYK